MRNKVEDIRRELVKLYENKQFRKSGTLDTVEIQNANFIADEEWIVRVPDYEYQKCEIEWYESQSMNVYDIPGIVPKIWKQVADINGDINSNYGWCIFSKENGSQYKNCLWNLINDHNTRQAVMIYTRPSMQQEWNKNHMHDFMCTHYVHCFLNEIDEGVYELLYIIYQRSCDAVFGYNNDYAWHKHVYDKMIEDLNASGLKVMKRLLEYNCGSLHVYDRHFKFLEELKNE